MKKHGGRIINFGSGAATMGMPVLAAYNIAKEAVRGLTKTAAMGWGKYGITVNTICPLATTLAYETWFSSLTDQGKQAHLDRYPVGSDGRAGKGYCSALRVPCQSRWWVHHKPYFPRRWRELLLRPMKRVSPRNFR